MANRHAADERFSTLGADGFVDVDESDDVIIVSGGDNLMPTIDLSFSEAPAAVAIASSSTPSASSSGNASKYAVGAPSVCDESVSATAASASASVTETAAAPAVLECPICLQTCIHPARLPCGHIFCFLCVKGVAYKNRRCAMCRREIPPEFLDHPQLVNGIDDICTTKATDDGYQWFYEGRNGGWWAYDRRSSDEIEAAYLVRCNASVVDLEGDDSRYDLLVCGAIYTIDFGDMVQFPQNMIMRRRKIRRARNLPPTMAKGVAGISKWWWQYDDRTSQDIEDAYHEGKKSCTILVAGYVYVVDLEAMLQQRQNEPTRCRHVKRDLATIPKKGVAGLRIEGNTVTTDSNFASLLRDQRRVGAGGSSSGADDDENDDYDGVRRHHRPSSATGGDANASNFISTIVASDAAIRIASDIIGSTLAAHADELAQLRNFAIVGSATTSLSTPAATLPANTSGEQYSNSTATSTTTMRGSRELHAAEDRLDATQNVVVSAADQQTMFEQTLNDFHALTLRNMIDSSEEEEEEQTEEPDAEGGGNNTSNSSGSANFNGVGHRGPMKF